MIELYKAIPYDGAYHYIFIQDDAILDIFSHRPVPPEQQTDRLWHMAWEERFRQLPVADIRNGIYTFALVGIWPDLPAYWIWQAQNPTAPSLKAMKGEAQP